MNSYLPKNPVLKILAIILIIFVSPIAIVIIAILAVILIPIAALAHFIDAPKAKKRLTALPLILKNDWEPRKKYVYIGFHSDIVLADYLRNEIIKQYGVYIVWDEWNPETSKWTNSEPDNFKRVTTFWTDIGGDWDDNSVLFIGTYNNKNYEISDENDNFHSLYFSEDPTDVLYNGEEIIVDEAKNIVLKIIEDALKDWTHKK